MSVKVRERAAAMSMEYRCAPEWVNEAAKVLGQCAEELMRAEMYEKHVKGVSVPDYQATIAALYARHRPLEDEITRLNNEVKRLESRVDTAGMKRAWDLGFRDATEQLVPTIVNLLNASYTLALAQHDHHHHDHKETQAAGD